LVLGVAPFVRCADSETAAMKSRRLTKYGSSCVHLRQTDSGRDIRCGHGRADPKELRDKAAKYRAFARATDHDETANRIFQLAAELEQQARDVTPDE
jgi:hypothetical protein